MRQSSDPLTRAQHRIVAAYLFNRTWELMDRQKRTREEDDEMQHAAHASRYHWEVAGTSVNVAIGEWQISRVYALLGRAEPARYHARRSLDIAERRRLGRFHLAYAYEALARAASVDGARRSRAHFLRRARKVGETVRDLDDRRMLFEDLATIP